MGDVLATLDAVGQAELVRRREASPRELVDAAIARIERLNPLLNAVISPLFDEARAQAASRQVPAGPFRGVPFLMKDLGAAQAGQPYYAGNRALRDAEHRSRLDSHLGRRFRAAGLVTLGKTNTPEFGLQSTTQPLAFGPTRNPWDLERSPSGSSGGACAAVAAGLVPVAHADDGAGSIRLPASWCGLVGLKPSRGRIPLDAAAIGRGHVGFAVTRTLRDAAALLDALSGSEPGDLYAAPPPRRPYAAEIGAAPGSLSIGFMAHALGARVHPECTLALEQAAVLLEALGHAIEPAFPAALLDEERAWRGLVFGPTEYRLCLRSLARLLGRAVGPDDVEPYLWSLATLEQRPVTAEEYLEAAEWRQGWASRVASWWEGGYDLLLTPTVCEPPATLSELAAPADEAWKLLDRVGPHLVFTEPWNVTGQPALSLPLHWTRAGLPVGIQLVAAFGREDLLLRVGSQLEQARPWKDHRPPIHA